MNIKYLSILGIFAISSLMADDQYMRNSQAPSTMVQNPPAGSQMLYSEDGAQVEKRADGSKVIKTTDGTTVEVRADGSKTVRKRDGTTIEIKGNR